MNKVILFSTIVTLTFLLSFSIDSAFAHPHSGQIMINDHIHEPQTEIIPLNGMIGLEKSTVPLKKIHYLGHLLKEKLQIMLKVIQ